MSSFGDEWAQRTGWKKRVAYRVASRNGAIAFWVGAAILIALFYTALFELIVTRIWG